LPALSAIKDLSVSAWLLARTLCYSHACCYARAVHVLAWKLLPKAPANTHTHTHIHTHSHIHTPSDLNKQHCAALSSHRCQRAFFQYLMEARPHLREPHHLPPPGQLFLEQHCSVFCTCIHIHLSFLWLWSALRYSVPEWLIFFDLCGVWGFTVYVAFPSFSQASAPLWIPLLSCLMRL